jgi:4-amino-4-deoxy-L-arabinose transferase-like glycosyltransferase
MAVLAVLGFALVLALGIALRPLLAVDETRYLSVAWEMWQSGDWLVPTRNGEIYAHKPPLLFWLVNLVWAAAGVSEFAARLVGPAFALASVGATWLLAQRLWPEMPRIGARAVLVLCGFSIFALYGGLTMFDTMLTLATVLGMLALIGALRHGRGRDWALFGAAIALGVYAKGPVILLHLMPAALAWRLWFADPPPAGRVARGLGIALATALGLVALWLVPAAIVGGAEYRHAILWTQSAGRVTEAFAHARPWWFFLALLPVLWFPWIWSPLVWRGLWRLPRSDAGVRLCLIWVGSALLLFSAISSKQAHYLIPEYPALALLLARTLPSVRGRHDLLPPVAALALVGLGLLGAAVGLVPLGAAAPLLQPRILLGVAGIALVLPAALALRVRGAAGLAILGLGLVPVLHLPVVLTGLGRAWDSHPIAAVLAGAEAAAIVGESYSAEFNFTGRLTRPVAVLDPGEVPAWLSAHPGGVLLGAVGRVDPGWPASFELGYRGTRYGLWHAVERPEAPPSLVPPQAPAPLAQ